MSRLVVMLDVLLSFSFRLLGLFVACALVVFPAFKGMPAGYVPVLAGLVMALVLLIRPVRCAVTLRLEGLPTGFFCAVLMVGPAIVQILLIVFLRPEPLFDGLYVLREARAFFSTGTMDPLTYYPPGQTWYYALAFLIGGASDLTAQLCQVPLLAVISFLVFRLARRGMPEGMARLCALACGWYPSFLLYVLVTPYYFYLYTCLMLWAALWWVKSTEDVRAFTPFMGGVFAAAGALVKPVMLIAPAQAVAFWLLYSRGSGTLLKKTLFLCIGFSVLLAPWIMRNLSVFGEPVAVCTSGGLVLYSANNPDSNGLYSPIPDQAEISTPQEMLKHSHACSEKAWEYILGDPAGFAKLAVKKHLYSWGNETTYAALVNVRGRVVPALDSGISAVAQSGWAAVVFLWFLVAIRRGRADGGPLSRLAGIIVVSNWLVYLLYEGGERHHLPMVPFILLAVFESLAAGDPDSAQEPD